MYCPEPFRERDPIALARLVRDHPFATLISQDRDRQEISHVPLSLTGEANAVGRLLGHVARENRHADLLSAGAPTTAIFLGPHAFVSPRSLVSQPALPTWNYAVVHAEGRPRALAGREAGELVEALTLEHEPAAAAWLEELPPGFRERMLAGVLAFEIQELRWLGKFKLTQNRPAADQRAMSIALERSERPEARALGALARRRLPDPARDAD